MFTKIFEKEIKSLFVPAVFVIGLIGCWDLFLGTRIRVWPGQFIGILAFLPGMIPAIWLLAMGFQSLHAEWNSNSIYLLLSLPVRGWKVTGAKLVADLVSSIIIGLVSLAGLGILLTLMGTKLLLHVSAGIIVFMACATLFFMALVIAISQFSFITGHLVPKFRGAFSLVTFFLCLGVYFKLTAWLLPLLNWLPSLEVGRAGLPTGFLLLELIFFGIFFTAGSLLFEKRVEL
ncbi:MAG TPA: ABC transporter permease subunit [Bacillota bacterium]